MSDASRPIHVFVVAPAMLCWGFEKLVRTACAGIHMTGSAPTLAEALASPPGGPVDVLVVDLDEGYGEEALLHATRRFPVLLLTSRRPSAVLDQFGGLGIKAVVRKSDPPPEVVAAIEAANSAGGPDGRPAPAWGRLGTVGDPPADAEQARIAALTARERQLILAVLCNAPASGKVIAGRLCISEHTLRNHLTSIYRKLGVRNRLSLHAYAARHQLDQPISGT
ncbi:helix-turn-helix transcriptional regulator [Ramlibacter sp.]|uniref:helix-turn-helix transcriptional regulator n=1 Tax=Ramlibacter sp. TaxID=1917967 RepID=UPI002FC64D40